MEQDVYRPSRTLSRWLIAALLLYLALNIAVNGTAAVIDVYNPGILDENAEFTGAHEVVAVLVLIVGGVGAILALITCIVLFCIWIRRANQNASALGARGMEFTPGWAAGWFFVPFANLFKPYQAMREIYHASDPDRDDESDESALVSLHWSNEPAPTQMKLWWATWILMGILDNASMRHAFRDDAASQASSVWLGVGAAVLAIPCTVLVVWLVLAIDERQARRHAKRVQPSGS